LLWRLPFALAGILLCAPGYVAFVEVNGAVGSGAWWGSVATQPPFMETARQYADATSVLFYYFGGYCFFRGGLKTVDGLVLLVLRSASR